MLEPQKAIPFFAPAGIALGALLCGGARLWPGAFAGAFLFSLHLSAGFEPAAWIEPGVAVPSLFIAAGAVLQALAGNAWLRRAKIGPGSIESFRDIFILVFLACPLSCLISASVAACAISVARQSPLSDLGFTWVAWWSGDTTAAVVLAPAMLLLRSASVSRTRKVVVGAAAVLLPVSIVLWSRLHAFESLQTALLVGLGGTMLLTALLLRGRFHTVCSPDLEQPGPR